MREIPQGKSTSGEITGNTLPPHSYIRPVNFADAVSKSGVTPDQIATLESGHPKGIMSLTAFFTHWMEHPDLQEQGGYSLGVTNNYDLQKSVTLALGLTPSDTVYARLDLHPDPKSSRFAHPTHLPETHTDIFLTTITKEDTPIVFFIPSHVFDYDPEKVRNYTRDEMRWFLNHPDKVGNVFFVFGLFDAISEEDLVRINEQYHRMDERLTVMAQMFQEQVQ